MPFARQPPQLVEQRHPPLTGPDVHAAICKGGGAVCSLMERLVRSIPADHHSHFGALASLRHRVTQPASQSMVLIWWLTVKSCPVAAAQPAGHRSSPAVLCVR